MKTLIFEIVSIAAFSCIVAEFSGIMQWVKWKLNIRRLKPLDCEKCLAWWIALIYFYHSTGGILLSVGCAALCSVLSIYIVRYAK